MCLPVFLKHYTCKTHNYPYIHALFSWTGNCRFGVVEMGLDSQQAGTLFSSKWCPLSHTVPSALSSFSPQPGDPGSCRTHKAVFPLHTCLAHQPASCTPAVFVQFQPQLACFSKGLLVSSTRLALFLSAVLGQFCISS